MALFLITRKDEVNYGEQIACVVRAKSRREARMVASKSAGDEGSTLWIDTSLTKCSLLVTHGDSKLILAQTLDS